MTNVELETIISAIEDIAANHEKWGEEYSYNPHTNEFYHTSYAHQEDNLVTNWFEKALY